VVDDAVIGIMAARSAVGRIEARVCPGEAARRSERGHNSRVKLNVIPSPLEAVDSVRICGTRRSAERKGVLLGAGTQGIVASAAIEEIGAVIVTKNIVAIAAEQDIVTGAGNERVVAIKAD